MLWKALVVSSHKNAPRLSSASARMRSAIFTLAVTDPCIALICRMNLW